MIGLGIMGSGMAGQLLEKGFALTVWNRDPAKTTALVKKGARLAESPADLAAHVEVVITMIRDDAAVRQVLLGPQGALAAAGPGTVFINMSTTTPALAHELAKAMAAKGCVFLGAPVTGSKAAAASGQLNILASGNPADLEAQRDVLAALGNITHVGPVGAAATLKLANNALAATLLAAMGEALALCESAELSRELVVETLAATAARVCGLKKTKVINRDWSTDFALELMLKDLNQALDTARGGKVLLPLVTAVQKVYDRMQRQGRGAQDFSIVADRG